jgi:thymidylate synthase
VDDNQEEKKILYGFESCPDLNLFKTMSIQHAIRSARMRLNTTGETVKSKKWQAIDSPDALLEVTDIFLKMDMPEDIKTLASDTQADLPWAENHFQERVSGNPANPGFEYQNWPYYKAKDHNDLFRAEGEGFFSHTYMERFWPDKNLVGTGAMGYKFGDFHDLIQRLKDDPHTRQAFFAIWHPQDHSNDGVRLPCTIGYHFRIRKGKLDLTYLIRSCDYFRHFRNDIYMSVRLAQYVRAEVQPTLRMGSMAMWIGSLHCFASERSLL